jgi:general secretion pathway protein C
MGFGRNVKSKVYHNPAMNLHPLISRLCAFSVWAAVAMLVVYWGLRLGVRPAAGPPAMVVDFPAVSGAGDLTRLFGTPAPPPPPPAPPPMSTRFRLVGLVAPLVAGTGDSVAVALIGVDGQAPKAYQIGMVVDGDLVVQSIAGRSVALGPPGAPVSVVLEVPPLPTPAVGYLPPLPQGFSPAPMPAPMPAAVQAPLPMTANTPPPPPPPAEAPAPNAGDPGAVAPAEAFQRIPSRGGNRSPSGGRGPGDGPQGRGN